VHGIYFFLARITPNYLELPRISQNRGQVIMNNIGSMSMGEGGVPSEITVTTSHFSEVAASQEDGFGNNRHINRHVTDRETSQEGGRVEPGEARYLISGDNGAAPHPRGEKPVKRLRGL
jgi:hypothetical protein